MLLVFCCQGSTNTLPNTVILNIGLIEHFPSNATIIKMKIAFTNIATGTLCLP